jgi:uncharacterized membrane protein YedE/YeeE
VKGLREYGPPLVSGVLFGAGLALSGMTDPARVRGFLDIAGAWDPTLAFVMGGALAVMAVAWRLAKRMGHPWFAATFAIPDRTDITPRLVGGAALFGIGWGLAGICPGPAIATLAFAPAAILPFLFAMVAGMALARLLRLA